MASPSPPGRCTPQPRSASSGGPNASDSAARLVHRHLFEVMLVDVNPWATSGSHGKSRAQKILLENPKKRLNGFGGAAANSSGWPLKMQKTSGDNPRIQH